MRTLKNNMTKPAALELGTLRLYLFSTVHESQLIFELPANLETIAIIDSVIGCPLERFRASRLTYGIKKIKK